MVLLQFPGLHQGNVLTFSDVDNSSEPFVEVDPNRGQEPEDISAETRSEGLGVVLQGIVLSHNGHAVPAAQVRWLSLPEVDYNYRHSWATDNFMQGTNSLVETNAAGVFSFVEPSIDVDKSDSVLWATHPDYEALAFQLLPLDPADTRIHRIQFLQPATARVTVAASDGRSVSAIVHQRGISPEPIESPDSFSSRAYRVFASDFQCGPEGSAFSPLQGRQVIWAESMGLQSDPWNGTGAELHAGQGLRLVLEPGFQTAGRVINQLDGSLPSDLKVELFEVYGKSSELAGGVLVGTDATWGPVRVPLSATRKFFLELSGTGVVAYRVDLQAPRGVGFLSVDLVAQSAPKLDVWVQDAEGALLHDAYVLASWHLSGKPGYDRARTNSQGVATLSGCPATTVRVDAEKPGFVMPRILYLGLSPSADNAVTIEMQRAGTIRGLCQHNDLPVPEFEVVFWHGNPADSYKVKTFAGSDDGRFEITGAPLGRVSLFAASEKHPRSVVQVVEVREDGPAEVVIELPDPILGVGQVVDLETGAPISGARVQLYTSYQSCYFSSWGEPAVTDSNGQFRLEGFPPGDSRYCVRAGGYVQYLGQAYAAPQVDLELGILPLCKAQTVTVKLESDVELDFSQYRVHADGNQPFPEQPFSTDGIARYEGAGPGLYYVQVDGPQDSRSLEKYLYPGDDWTFVFSLGTKKTLRLQVVGADGQSATQLGVAWVDASCESEQGIAIRETRMLSAEGEVVFTDLVGDRVTAEAVDQMGKGVGLMSIDLVEQETSAELIVGGPGLQVRVIHPDGSPIEGATVALYSGDVGFEWSVRGATDASGEYAYPSVSMKKLVINVAHPIYGHVGDILVSDLDEPVLVVLDAEAKIRVRLMDGDEPLFGVQTRVYSRSCEFEIGDYPSSAAGIVASGAVAEGSYRMVVRQPGIWGVEHIVQAKKDETPVDVQVRRLGDLKVTARTTKGDPVVGGVVEIISLETGTSIADWIAAGRLKASTELMTDGQGELSLTGLPNGTYRVTVQHPDFAPTTVETNVPPRATHTEHVMLK